MDSRRSKVSREGVAHLGSQLKWIYRDLRIVEKGQLIQQRRCSSSRFLVKMDSQRSKCQLIQVSSYNGFTQIQGQQRRGSSSRFLVKLDSQRPKGSREGVAHQGSQLKWTHRDLRVAEKGQLIYRFPLRLDAQRDKGTGLKGKQALQSIKNTGKLGEKIQD